MNKVTMVGALVGLTVAGVGIGAGIAAVMTGGVKNIRLSAFYGSPSDNLPDNSVNNNVAIASNANSTNINFNPVATQSCRLNSTVAVANSLNGAWQAAQIATNPLPAWQYFNNQMAPDLVARLYPAPFPQISDRARRASVPIVMYHDITKDKQLDWDVTPEELEQHFATIQANGLTPITMDQLVNHLRTGATLPANPILLTFDDNYLGQYEYAFPLLKKYGYPAVWSIHTGFVGKGGNKPKANWDQIREMYKSGLITIASHTVNHFNLSRIDEAQVDRELRISKQVLEKELGIAIKYFTYPEGSYSDRIKDQVKEVGYEAALTMSLDPRDELPAEKSDDLLAIRRYGQSRFADVIAIASNGVPDSGNTSDKDIDNLPDSTVVNFASPISKKLVNFDGLPITLISGGRPVTVHHHTRAQVREIMKTAKAIAAVDGGFFSLQSLESNKMIGPVLSQFAEDAGVLDVGRSGENPLLKNRPLVLISPSDIKFIPYNPTLHSTKEQLQAEMPDVTDAFVAAGWLVKNGQPQDAASFGKLYGFDANRDRAFWGIDRKGRPVIGVTMEMIDSVNLGKLLAKAGLQEAVMLDSGASASLAYRGKSLMSYDPRPVPHIVALLNPDQTMSTKWDGAVTCLSRN
ncbi:putative xylanase/chitin deacetylase [Synechococcus sp. PCC 7502]|uniref:polysaccharide deacetylase family protein n=1 Tax=Synechococcus sp. PCC 7502 TaxID=1173263 RepID=UPI00029FEA5F|nr:polysaccharide deacetylase family protein [Synechococcus sp. PCC 7502]AFY73646.1 putative xylanase/chitin deacetylase [Synechococcus sp. PCC 7502]